MLVTYLLGTRSANIWSKHNLVGTLAMHVLLFELAVEDLNVTPAAINVLLVLHRELHHEVLALVAEGLELARNRVEPRVLTSLDALVGIIVEKLPCRVDETAEFLAGVFTVNPIVLPCV